MLKPLDDYSDLIGKLYVNEKPNNVINFTFQVTEACNLACTYCYEINKQPKNMDFEIAKKAVDFIFKEAEKEDSVLSYTKNKGIIFEFIGGEPLMCMDLIRKIADYIETRLIELDSPWLLFHKYSFSTNGVLYFQDNVQDFLRCYSGSTSMSVTVDGCKELHDKCRLFPDGTGSYDLAIAASLDQKNKYGAEATKITLSPENMSYLFVAMKNLLGLGYRYINANCVFEEGWEQKDAVVMYDEMKKLSDYVLENDLEDKWCCSLYSEDQFVPMDPEDNDNWCGGTGKMLSINWKGDFYPCIRYMPTSLGCDREPLPIGNLDDGIYATCETCKIFEEFEKVTRRSQSTDECFNCPIARGCAWCSGYNYQKFGTVNHRATYICIMHKARAIANAYYFAKEAKKKGVKSKVKLYLPEDQIIFTIGEERYAELKEVLDGCL